MGKRLCSDYRFPNIYENYRFANVQQWQKEFDILFCSITPTNLGELSKQGTVSESAHPEDSKTVTGS